MCHTLIVANVPRKRLLLPPRAIVAVTFARAKGSCRSQKVDSGLRSGARPGPTVLQVR